MEFLSKESINSKELLDQINIFREMEYKEKEANNILTEAEKKRGRYTKLKHKTLLGIIRNEFNIQVNEQNILPVENKIIPTSVNGIFETSYKDDKGELRPMFILTIDQAKQVLLREARIVRRKVIEYLNLLEKRIRQLERKKGITARKGETEAIKMLLEYGNIPKEKQHLYYMTYSKLPFVALGMKRVSRDKLPADNLEEIKELENIIEKTILKGIVKKLEVKAIYKECKKACIDSLVDIEQKLIS